MRSEPLTPSAPGQHRLGGTLTSRQTGRTRGQGPRPWSLWSLSHRSRERTRGTRGGGSRWRLTLRVRAQPPWAPHSRPRWAGPRGEGSHPPSAGRRGLPDPGQRPALREQHSAAGHVCGGCCHRRPHAPRMSCHPSPWGPQARWEVKASCLHGRCAWVGADWVTSATCHLTCLPWPPTASRPGSHAARGARPGPGAAWGGHGSSEDMCPRPGTPSREQLPAPRLASCPRPDSPVTETALTEPVTVARGPARATTAWPRQPP